MVQIRSDFDCEHSQILGLIFAYHQYSNELKILEQELDKKKLAAQSGQEVYRAQHEKNMVMKAEIE